MEIMDLKKKSREIEQELDVYVKAHLEELTKEFTDCFLEFCKEIAKRQKKGEKDKIAYIHFSVLRTNILLNKHELRIDAYDENWFIDRNACSWKYPVEKIYSFLEKYSDLVEQYRINSEGKIDLSMAQNRIFEESNFHLFYISEIIRLGMRTVVQSNEYLEMDRADCFVVCIGGYLDKFDILYKEDKTKKDSKEVKRYLESKKQKIFSHEVYESLDLSKGMYDGLEFQYSSFEHTNLSGSDMSHWHLLFGNMKYVIMKDSKMENAKVFDVDFSGATLENVSFSGSKLKYVSFRNAKLKGVDFSKAILAEELDFNGAIMEDCKFWGRK